jgi:molybdopterin converting factor small subunit
MNQYTVLFFGPLQDKFGVKQMAVEMSENCTVIALLEELGLDESILNVAIDGKIVPLETNLSGGCEIALLPPVSGG